MHDPQRFAVAIIVGGEPVHEPFTERFPLGYAQAGAKIVPPERPESYAEPFAPEELDLITTMHTELVDSLRLGLSVFLTGSAALGDARRLVARKRQLRRLEAEAAALSLRTLQGSADGTGAVTTRIDNTTLLRK